ncbi:MAG: phosphotransferase [Chloroflexi bacterium]|nr:phosphotransferase [Chloroflexota bacterium]
MPARFVRRNGVDPAWLAGLPAVVDRFAQRWSLAVDPPFPGIEYNFVAPATRGDGTRCVFKLSREVDETRNEIAALRLWNGAGAVRLLDAEPNQGALLLERLEPGTALLEVASADDDRATRIAVEVLRQLWRPARPEDGLRSLERWCDGYERNRAALHAGAGGFPAALFDRADAMRRELLASTPIASALHGDLHHYNILRAQRADWLAIDPKGLMGDRAFDVCQFFRNPDFDRPPARRVNARRLDIFCAGLELDRQRVKDWGLVHAVLDACWQYEDGNDWRPAVAYAEQTMLF